MAGDGDTEEEEEIAAPTVADLLSVQEEALSEIVVAVQEARTAARENTKLKARYLKMQDPSTSGIAKASITSATMAAYSVACAYVSED